MKQKHLICPHCGARQHPDRVRILEYLRKNKFINMNVRTMRQMMRLLNIEGGVQFWPHHIAQLEKQGLIIFDRYTGQIFLRKAEPQQEKKE